MVERGDVLRLKARLGFLPRGEVGSVVVVQAPSPMEAQASWVSPPPIVTPQRPALME